MNNITIGYLTWKNTKQFEKTLKSHKDNGLFDLIPPENRLVFIQEIDEEQINLAKKYECNYIGNENNIGNFDSHIRLIEECKTDYIIFCEDDFILMNTKEYDIKKTFEDAIEILKENENTQIKLSNIKKPGYLYSTPRNKLDYWFRKNQNDFSYKIESFSWIDNPLEFYGNDCINIINKNYIWYVCSTIDQVWSNHIYIASIKYLKNIIIPILKYNRININPIRGGVEKTLVFFKDLIGKNKDIDKLLEIYGKSKVISGGGNFYHNKIPKGNRRKTDFYDNAYCNI